MTRKRKIAAVVIWLFFLGAMVRPAVLATGWYDSHWGFRRHLEVQNQTHSLLTDYPVKVILDSDNFNFVKAATNGADLRFTTNDGKTLLPYWIVKYDSVTARATIRVKISQIDPHGSTSFYLYYGNPQAPPASNGQQVFSYFADFNSFHPTVKFGILGDIHHDSNDNNYWITPDFSKGMLNNAQSRMEKFVTDMNQWGANFVLTIGDLVTAENWTYTGQIYGGEITETPQEERTSLSQIEASYSQFKYPRFYVLGNHEPYNLGVGQINAIIGDQGAIGPQPGIKQFYYSFNQGGVHFIILDLQYDPQTGLHRGPEGHSDYGIGYAPPEELNWLTSDLNQTNLPTVIFTHQRLDDTDFLTQEQCSQLTADQLNTYCTDSQMTLAAKRRLCANLRRYRITANAAAVRAILEQAKDKILVVFEGHDHANFNFNKNGINYRAVDDSDQEDPNQINYVKVKIDPVSRLVAIEGVGDEHNRYRIDYESGQMVLENSIDNYFLPALSSGSGDDEMMVEADWEIHPAAPAQQVYAGFYRDLDHYQIRHRCAPDGRRRRDNFIGIRRVYSQKGVHNYVGREQHINGQTNSYLDKPSVAVEGRFWVGVYQHQAQFWYGRTDHGEAGVLNPIPFDSTSFSPGVWLFDQTQAQIDNLIVRRFVDPEPTVSFQGTLETPPPTVSPNDLNGDGQVDGADVKILLLSWQ